MPAKDPLASLVPIKRLHTREIESLDGHSSLQFPTPERTSYPEIPMEWLKENFALREHDEESMTQLRIAAAELLANAIDYGNNRNSQKTLEIHCGWSDDCFLTHFYFAVIDQGEGFDTENPIYRGWGPPEGSYGLQVARANLSLLYNFKDSASYGVKRVNDPHKG